MTGHQTYDHECLDCQHDWITKRWGCRLLGPAGDRATVARCPECGATDATSHPYDCEYWYGSLSPANEPGTAPAAVYRFDDTEPFTPDEEHDAFRKRQNISRAVIIAIFTAVAVIVIVAVPILPSDIRRVICIGSLAVAGIAISRLAAMAVGNVFERRH